MANVKLISGSVEEPAKDWRTYPNFSPVFIVFGGPQVHGHSLFDTVAALAAASPRMRMDYNFHSDPADNPHRFLNVLLRGTYIRPHRRSAPPKSESFLVLEGMADVILFDDEGAVTTRYRLGAESPEGRLWGVDISPGVWHTILARTRRVVCFEVKPGPWMASNDKQFGIWAPAESDPDAAAYCQALLDG